MQAHSHFPPIVVVFFSFQVNRGHDSRHNYDLALIYHYWDDTRDSSDKKELKLGLVLKE